MGNRIGWVARALVGRRAWMRWAYLVVGGALFTPFFFVTLAVGQLFGPFEDERELLILQLLGWVAALPLVALVGLFPIVGVLERSAVVAMLGVPADRLTAQESWNARLRVSAWCVLHVGLGAVIAALSLATPPAAVLMLLAPWKHSQLEWLDSTYSAIGAFALLLGVAALLLLLVIAAVAGALLTRCVPFFLGISAADRAALAERRAAQLAQRNRVARELHDSVGHTLSVITIQAAAAARVLTTNPDFAEVALRAIEEAGRGALVDLDHVLGILREETASRSVPPDLSRLPELLAQVRSTGVEVVPRIADDVHQVPILVSREAYRIVQEGMTNAMRHAPGEPVTLRVETNPERLRIEILNHMRVGGSRHRSGERGLLGISERVAVLGGEMIAGAQQGQWQLQVDIPLRIMR
ncbi:MAG: hypothetical protein HOQ05_00115 [Corynebacteriales bacterium]|nr:hypothetical protein [Mycobacteriales bacterium]